jgi:ATP-dependent DNA helicase RecG
MINLSTDVKFISGVGEIKSNLLKSTFNIYTVEDLLLFAPYKYIDKSKILKIAEAAQQIGNNVLIIGIVSNVSIQGTGSKKRMIAILNDGSGRVELLWFQGFSYLKKFIVPNSEYRVYGRLTKFSNTLSISHPEIEFIADGNYNALGIEPIYNSSQTLKNNKFDSKAIAKIIKTVFEKLNKEQVVDMIPDYVRSKFDIIHRYEAFKNLHQPSDLSQTQKARLRFKFEEFFTSQTELLLAKSELRMATKGIKFDTSGELLKTFYKEYIPFELTNAQKRVVREIYDDLKSGYRMSRLLQGDVGSGKSMVAFISMLIAIGNGYQTAYMAPTEILAQQQYASFLKFANQLGLEIRLLTGSTKTADRKSIANSLVTGKIDIIVGTHALLEDWVSIPKPGLVIIDEQHKFGVAQRARLQDKKSEVNVSPHILVMTATPIPRTLYMTQFGDLDVSVIDELPPGRQPITTTHIFDNQKIKMYDFISKELKKGRQMYVVYPLIEESEVADYASLMQGYDEISQRFPAPENQISIVHGRLKPEEKESEMQRFKKGNTNILVSTTVIEVGVDVPNATIMIIESANKFGLAQLHQLRGRVGRGSGKSYCFLVTERDLNEIAKRRISAMVQTQDGFELSNIDLEIRGPGDRQGTRQSGKVLFRFADIVNDKAILEAVRKIVVKIIDHDPDLSKPINKPLKDYILNERKSKTDWTKVS